MYINDLVECCDQHCEIYLFADDARVTYDLRKYYFTNRALNIWYSLPNHVVLSDTVNTFKSRLDKFWQHQDVIYDFKAEIHGTGGRSCY